MSWPSDPRRRFASAVLGHLRQLGWKQKTLAERAGLSESQVSGFLSSFDRSASKADVCRIAWAIAGGLDGAWEGEDKPEGQQKTKGQKKAKGTAREQLDAILYDFMEMAGYFPIAPVHENQVWSKMPSGGIEGFSGRPILKVGVYDFPPFWDAEEDLKVFEELILVVGDLLEVKVDFINVPLGNVEAALWHRDVDVLAPLITLPSRRRSMLFCSELPNIRVGLGIVTAQENNANLDEYLICMVKGDIAQSLFPFAMYDRNIVRDGEKTRQIIFFDNLFALQDLTKEVKDKRTGEPFCFMADKFTCEVSMKKNPNFKYIDMAPDFTFPMAFAVHPREKNLADAIDHCLNVLKTEKSNIFNELYHFVLKKYPTTNRLFVPLPSEEIEDEDEDDDFSRIKRPPERATEGQAVPGTSKKIA